VNEPIAFDADDKPDSDDVEDRIAIRCSTYSPLETPLVFTIEAEPMLLKIDVHRIIRTGDHDSLGFEQTLLLRKA
jgi:hypothetical protein